MLVLEGHGVEETDQRVSYPKLEKELVYILISSIQWFFFCHIAS